MSLLRLERDGATGWGVLAAHGIVDVSDLVGPGHGAIHAHLSESGLARLEEHALTRPSLPRDQVTLAPFLPDPEKILCVGVNYPDRNAEYRDGSTAPAYPSLFLRTPSSFVGDGAALVRPAESEQLDYEGEIVLVIGQAGRRIAREDAWRHVAGVTIMNEGTVRDWVRHAKFNVTQGKNFEASGAIGPWMVPAGRIEDPNALVIETRVNGELRQSDSASNMLFPIDYLINYISSFTTLRPGDLISTGTPTGAGARFEPPRYLVPGDRIEVTVSGVGTLTNGVVDG
jgi:2-keto-4-pentenoate hydratase/2-oxohepta-3-ene-1,7-dioic acid hydratase in catechol pathway